jgi:hypothetical protein
MNDILRTAHQVPWEKERQRRIADAIVSGLLREIEQPLWKNPAWSQPRTEKSDIYAREAALLGLPPRDGPGSRLSSRQWGELLRQFEMYGYGVGSSITQRIAARSQQVQHVAQLATAVALYQVEHGALPEKLDNVVPQYLKALPDDPFTGRSFRYRISQGEMLDRGSGPTIVVPGQALLESEADPTFVVPVPKWEVR